MSCVRGLCSYLQKVPVGVFVALRLVCCAASSSCIYYRHLNFSHGCNLRTNNVTIGSPCVCSREILLLDRGKCVSLLVSVKLVC